MTEPNRPRRSFDEPPPGIEAPDVLHTSAGSPVRAAVRVTNTAAEPRIISVTTMGVDAEWLPAPARSRPVMPGESITAHLVLAPSTGTVPARYPLALAVQALDPVHQQATSQTAVSEVVLVVGAPGSIGVALAPSAPTAVFSRRINAVLTNTGGTSELVELEVRQPHSIRVRFPSGPVEVAPGRTVTVAGRAQVLRPILFGARARHSFTVTARTSGAPRHAEGAVTARPFFGSFGTRTTAVLAVVAIWAALIVIFLPKLSDNVRHRAEKGDNRSTSANNGDNGSGNNGSGNGSGGNGNGGNGNGSGGNGNGNGSGGNGAGSGAASVQLNGTVGGNRPSGVNVQLSRTSLVSAEAAGANRIGQTQSNAPIGKLTEYGARSASAAVLDSSATTSAGASSGSATSAATRRTAPPTSSAVDRSVTTEDDGAWSFPAVSAPGYYLVTFAKPGYQTQRYVIDAASAAAAQPLKVTLQPGTGRLSGSIGSSAGPVGAATITITDGINTLTTSSNSTGSPGSWSVDGLSTPGTYLISASRFGMGTESALVDLPAGGSSSVNLRLPAGLGSLTGMVRGVDDDGHAVGLGGAQITASNGKVTRTSTTVTVGDLAGRYTLPDLPTGTYTVTMKADGYLTQTRQIVVSAGQSTKRVDATLTPATGSVTGVVRFGADVPDPENDGKFLTGPVEGAGLLLSSEENKYKITTGAGGTFRFTGVLPGTYVLSAQYAGLTTAYITVTVRSGQVSSGVNFSLGSTATSNTSTIAGFVSGSLSPSGTLICVGSSTGGGACDVTVHFTLYDSADPNTPVKTSTNGQAPYSPTSDLPAAKNGPTGYTLSAENGLAPGAYRLTISATGYLPATVTVRVPLNGTASAPAVTLHSANAISGTVNALGDVDGKTQLGLNNAGPRKADGTYPSYRNCIWAVPTAQVGGQQPTAPTTCPQPTEPGYPDASDCTQGGKPAPALTQLPDARQDGLYPYQISGLCDGNYAIFVVITNPWYVAPTPPASQTVSGGQTISFSPHVPRLGRVKVALSVLDPATNTSSTPAAADLEGTIGCGGTSVGYLDTISAGAVYVSGVPSGSGTSCNASGDATYKGTMVSGQVGGLGVQLDQDTPASMTLARRIAASVGRVVTRVSGSDQPVRGVVVTVTGVTGYDGNTPQTTTRTVTTDSNGCFAITPNAGGVNNPTFSTCKTVAETNSVRLALVSAKVTVSVAAGSTTGALPAADYTLKQNDINPFRVPASAAHIGDTAQVKLTFTATQPSGDPAPDFSGAQITVTSRPAESGTIQVTADADGTIHWRDSTQPSGDLVVPGTYTLRATLTSYQTVTPTLVCDPAKDCVVTAGSLTFVKRAHVEGTVNGVLAKADSAGAPVEQRNAATVIAVRCGEVGTTGTCRAPVAGDPSVSSNSSGFYTFGTTANPFALDPGRYVLVARSNGFLPYTSQPFDLDPGANVTGKELRPLIATRTVSIEVTAGTPPATFTHATVTLTNQDTKVPVTKSADANGRFVFPDLLPTGYDYEINGTNDPTGDTIQTSTGSIDVPRSTDTTNGPTVERTLKASQSTTAVTGVVTRNGDGKAMADATVSLGTKNAAGTFTVSKDVSGKKNLSQTTGADGAYRIDGIPSGSYYIQVTKTGYTTTEVGPYMIRVNDTLAIALQLTIRTYKVVVTITAPTGDDISAATQPTVTSKDPDGSRVADSTSAAAAPKFTYTFNQVPYGCSSFAITLPANHYGTLTQTSANGGCTGGFAVPGTSTGDVAVAFTLNEYQPKAAVTLTALDGDTAPATVKLTVTTGTGNPDFVNPAFPVSATAAALDVWVTGSQTVTLDVGKPGWPGDTDTVTSTKSAALESAETGATVTVEVTQGGAALPTGTIATVSLVAPTGITYTKTATTVTSSTVTLTDVPYGTGYTAHAEIDADHTGDSAAFDVDSATPPKVTVDINV